MISVDNLTVSFGGWDLFKDISLLVNPKDRIGLVGKNGAGKSTLLKVIAGEQPATSGTVTRSGDVTVGYLPQQMKVADTTSLVEETAGAFIEVIALEREIAELTEEIAVRTDYESADYEKLLHRLNDATDRYHILGGDNREAEIEKTKETYYEALAASSVGWNEGLSDYTPFVTYMLGVIGACYSTLDSRFSLLSSSGSNENTIREYFDSLIASASKREIMDANPTMSQRTVERILQKLQAEGYVEKIGAARSTRYRRAH